MIAILSLLVVLVISFLVTRIATVALMHTGLSREIARFQARSALTGSGFTTSESERVVNHPVRRRILMLLMLVGNAGIITAISSLMLAFIDHNDTGTLWIKIVLLVSGLVLLWTVAGSRWVDRHLSRVIDKALKRYTSLDVRDFASLLGLSGDYRIVEIAIGPSDWLANKTILEAGLREEGALVLAIQREDGTFLGTPDKQTRINAEDTLIVYGHIDALADLDERRYGAKGNRQHMEAVVQQKRRSKHEQQHDENKVPPAE